MEAAENIALSLRSGALPAKVYVIEQSSSSATSPRHDGGR
jgi:preprotein translocase subunit SecD